MSQQQQLLKQDMTVSQVLRTYGKQFRQIQERYSDGVNEFKSDILMQPN
jgi:hypothetical protein